MHEPTGRHNIQHGKKIFTSNAHDKRQYTRLAPENYCSLEILGPSSRYEFYLQWAEHRYFTKYTQIFRDYILNYYHLL